MNKLGLVFAGGGGKGGYEIGVWKYLHEIGLDKYVSVVSGTSVGALNSVLFGLGDIELAENIWCTKIKNKVLTPHKLSRYLEMGFELLQKPLPAVISVIRNLAKFGFYTRDGLVNIVKTYVDFDTLKKSKVTMYATCTYIPTVTGNQLIDLLPAKTRKYPTKYFKLNDESFEDLLSILLASSAIPAVFSPIKVKAKKYYDGGVKDNVPSKPLAAENCTHAIVVHLSHHKNPHSNLKINENIPNVIHIYPSKDLGNLFTGTLDFSPKGTKKRISLGETDAKNLHEELSHFLSDFIS